MTQGRLNHLMILSAYRNRVEEMDLRKVASIFVQRNGVADIHLVNSNFIDVAYLKWCIPHLNIFVNLWYKKKKKKTGVTKISKGPNSLKSPSPPPPGEIPSLCLCFDMLLLSIAYKVSTKKVQRNYLS